MILHKTSLLYYFLNTYGCGVSSRDEGVCFFFLRVFSSLFIFSALVIGIGFILSHVVAWVAACFVTGTILVPNNDLLGMLYVAALLLALVGIFLLQDAIANTEFFKNFRNKICVQVEIKD